MFSPSRDPDQFIKKPGEERKNISAELDYQNGGLDLEALEKSGALLSREQRYELTKEKETLGSDLRALEVRMKTEGGLYGEYNKLNDRLLRIEKILASGGDVKTYKSQNY